MMIESYTLELLQAGKLNAQSSANNTQGYIFTAKNGGRCCVQSWPQWKQQTAGDLLGLLQQLDSSPVEQQLQLLAGQQHLAWPQHLQQLWACCLADASARRSGSDLLAGIDLPYNNALVPVGAAAQYLQDLSRLGYERLKIKADGNILEYAGWLEQVLELERQWQLRLDFNACLQPQQAEVILTVLAKRFAGRIEYVEDPCWFDEQLWQGLSKCGLRLAIDMADLGAEYGLADYVRVIKPASQNWRLYNEQAELVFTGNMDHVLGENWAAVEAMCAKQAGRVLLQGGLQGFSYFKSYPASAELVAGPCFLRPPGVGLGCFSA